MKKTNLFLVSLVALVTLSIGFSACGGGGSGSAGTYVCYNESRDKITYELYPNKKAKITMDVTPRGGALIVWEGRWFVNHKGFTEIKTVYSTVDGKASNIVFSAPIVLSEGYVYDNSDAADFKRGGYKLTKIK